MFYIVMAIYFFTAGIVFSEMLDEAKTEPSPLWPQAGCIILSVLWCLLLGWWCLNLVCPTTKEWYIKLANTIFEDNETSYTFFSFYRK